METDDELYAVDKSVYVEQMDAKWYIFGDETGCIYGQYEHESEANEMAKEINKEMMSKVEHDN